MKPLHEYETPETNPYEGSWATEWPDGISIYEHARTLEQRLAACRETIESLMQVISTSDRRNAKPVGKARETLELTKPQ